MTKYKNKYRIESTRLPFWDYGSNAAYFVTICTRDRIHYFGEITDGNMELSAIGELAKKYWFEIPAHFPFVNLGAFVVMPHHVHGIIIIDKPDNEHNNRRDNDERNVETPNLGVSTRKNGDVDIANVETQNIASLPLRTPSMNPPQHPTNKFGPQSQNLASIVRGYKIGVTKNARKINPDFGWQPRYYEHIIRNEKSFYDIEKYILNNPLEWMHD